jgi:hypothetical protein
MSSNQHSPAPQDSRGWAFHQTLRVLDAIVPLSFRKATKLLLFQISPDIPASLTSAWKDASLNVVFTIAASLTFIMCFVVVVVWSAVAGTLTGDDPSRLYFLKDWVNVLNYTLLCPVFIGFGAVLIATTVRGWGELNELTSKDVLDGRAAVSHYRIFVLMLLVLSAAFYANIKFMTENMNPSIYSHNYWFMDHVRPDGSRVIGAFGFYYGLLNFCLVLFSILVVATFVSQFRLLMQIAESLERLNADESMSTEHLRSRLTTFTQSYLAGKLVVAAYMVNALAWKTSQVQHSTNLWLYGGALTFFGVVFLSFPRYYVELQWFRLRTATPHAAMAAQEIEDLRPGQLTFVGGSWKPKVAVGFIDALFIGSFITSFWLSMRK